MTEHCDHPATSNARSAGMDQQTDLLTCFLDRVWSGGDLAPIDRMLSERYTIHHDPGDPWEGRSLTRAEFKDRVRTSRAPFPDQRFDVQDLVSSPGKVAVSWLWSGTHKLDFAGFKASGNLLKMSGMTLYFFSDGLLSGHWQMVDRLAIYRQLMAAAEDAGQEG